MPICDSRHRQAVWGLNGGGPGTTNRVEIDRSEGARETHALVSGLGLANCDVVRITNRPRRRLGRARRVRQARSCNSAQGPTRDVATGG